MNDYIIKKNCIRRTAFYSCGQRINWDDSSYSRKESGDRRFSFTSALMLSVMVLCWGVAAASTALAQEEMADGVVQPEAVGQALSDQHTFPARLAASSLVLDVIQAGNRYIAVGERGHILLSDDGEEWRQSLDVPTRSNLTSVYFRGGKLWAVGHDAVVIHSADLGETWRVQYSDPDAEQPLMDIVFTDVDHGVAIGAYSLVLTTSDGGENWQPDSMVDLVIGELSDLSNANEMEGDALELPDDEPLTADTVEDGEFLDEGIEYHLNAILELGDEMLLVAAEAGNGYRSDDAGQNWYHFTFPYAGSMFGLIAEDAACVLAYGLRGHIQRSCDNGASWTELSNSNLGSLFGAAQDAGGITLVGANGALVRVAPKTEAASLQDLDSGEDLAAVLATTSGLVIAGEDGLSLAFPRTGENAADDGEE